MQRPLSPYDAANQQLVLGNTSTTFDNNGNLATVTDTSGTTTYTWNARDQLVSLSGPGVTASFAYDASGRRKSKTVNGTTTNFLYDGLNVVQELNGTTPIANLLTSLGIDETLLRTDAASARSFLADGLGSTLALTDSAGLVQSEYTYEPFGKTTATGVTSTNAFKYTGREDDGTGLYYYRARYYHPALQRFVSEDPIEFEAGDPNLYAYVFNDPINLVDPLGLVNCGPRGCNGGMGGGVGGGGGGGGIGGGRGGGGGGAKPAQNFKPPTNPPQLPPGTLPPGVRCFRGKPTQQYPDGYWKLEKWSGKGWQRLDPRTMKPGSHPDAHVPFPQGYGGPYDN